MNSQELRRLIQATAADADQEVITRALSRDILLPHANQTAVLITLDNGHDHTRPTTLGARGLRSTTPSTPRRLGQTSPRLW